MSTRSAVTLSVALLLGALVPAARAQAPVLPEGTIAQVGEVRTTTRTDLDHWIAIAAASAAEQAGGSRAVPAEGSPAWRELAVPSVDFLVSAGWIEGEAAEQRLTVSDAEVERRYARTHDQSFPTRAAFARFLRQSRMTEADLRLRVRLDLLSDAVRQAVVAGVPAPTDAQAQTYFRRHRARFAQPERRDLHLVLTRTRAGSLRALAALRAGRSFGAVARRSSIDQASRSQGGVLLQVARGQQERALDRAVFRARRGVLTGPVHTQFGFYLFRVDRVHPPTRPTFSQVRETILQLLTSEAQRQALERFAGQFRARWLARTTCALPSGLTAPDSCPA